MSVRPGFLLFLVDDPLPGANDFLLVGQGLKGVFVGEEVDVGLADRFVGILQSEITCHRLIDADEAALGILEIDVVRQVIHQRVQQVAFLLQTLVGGRKFGGAIADTSLQFCVGLAKLLFRLAKGAEKGSNSRQPSKQTYGNHQSQGFHRIESDTRVAQQQSIKKIATPGQPSRQCRPPQAPTPTSDP